MAGFQGQLEGVRFEPTEMVEEGGRVLVGFALTGRGATSGIEVTQSGAGAVWVRDGLITRMEGHPDLEAARSAPRDPPPC
jgi:ketosteroid isomerase-like protein